MKDGNFRVHFIDYGNEEVISDRSAVRPITAELTQLAAQAVPAGLHGKRDSALTQTVS